MNIYHFIKKKDIKDLIIKNILLFYNQLLNICIINIQFDKNIFEDILKKYKFINISNIFSKNNKNANKNANKKIINDENKNFFSFNYLATFLNELYYKLYFTKIISNKKSIDIYKNLPPNIKKQIDDFNNNKNNTKGSNVNQNVNKNIHQNTIDNITKNISEFNTFIKNINTNNDDINDIFDDIDNININFNKTLLNNGSSTYKLTLETEQKENIGSFKKYCTSLNKILSDKNYNKKFLFDFIIIYINLINTYIKLDISNREQNIFI